MGRYPLCLCLLTVVLLFTCVRATEPVSDRADRVEEGLRPAIVLEDAVPAMAYRLSDRMRFYKVPGVSIAVIDEGQIAWARGYGLCDGAADTPVTPNTLFQAASLSKPVAAYAALRLVDQGLLELDENVNNKLRTWKLPDNEWTAETKVSLRLLLGHRAGLADYAGFHGVSRSQAMPSLREILATGKWTPAPIRVSLKPGTRFAYSGGGYCLVEQLMEDVSAKSFAALASNLVFEPLQMASSSFDQGAFRERMARASVGHQRNGKKLAQDWNLYPATGAAGLWTTPSDLARFAVALQRGNTNAYPSILSHRMITEMLSTQGQASHLDSKTIAIKEGFTDQPFVSWGLGVGLIGNPPTRFFHTGSNPGYQCEMQVFRNRGQGAVVMTNGDQGWRLAREVLWAIALEYRWPDYEYCPEIKRAAALTENELERFVGRYQISFSDSEFSPWVLNITRTGSQLTAQIYDFSGRVALYPQSNDTCFSIEDAMTLKFQLDVSGSFAKIVSDGGWYATRQAD